jgi:hypothetical protein
VQVQQLKATVELLQLHGLQHKQLDPAVNSLSSLLTSLSGLQHKQQQWQQQQQQHRQPPTQQQQQALGAAQASPLDKVAAALQSALEAATSWSSGAGLSAGVGRQEAASTSTAAAAGSNSSRRSSLQPWPNGVTAAGSMPLGGAQLPGLATEGSWVSCVCLSCTVWPCSCVGYGAVCG